MSDYTTFEAAAEAFHDAEFGTAFIVQSDGSFEQTNDYSAGDTVNWYGPDNAEGYDEIMSDSDCVLGDWHVATGMTGQHGYDGPLMHESETFGAGILSHLMHNRNRPLVVSLAAVADYSDDAFEKSEQEDNSDAWGELFSWVTLYREAASV